MPEERIKLVGQSNPILCIIPAFRRVKLLMFFDSND